MIKPSMNDLNVEQVNREIQQYLDVNGPFVKVINDLSEMDEPNLQITPQMKDVQTFPDISYVFMRNKIEALLDKYRFDVPEESLAIRVYHGCRERKVDIDPDQKEGSTIPTLVMVACSVCTDENGNVTSVTNLTNTDSSYPGGGGLEYPKHYGSTVPINKKFDVREDNYKSDKGNNYNCNDSNNSDRSNYNYTKPEESNNPVSSNQPDFLV